MTTARSLLLLLLTGSASLARAQGVEAIGPAPESSLDARRQESLVSEDVEPTVPILRTPDFDLRVGGLIQLQAAPWVGEDSLVANGDPATRAGMRVRRARFGFEGQFAGRLGLLLAVNPLESDEEVGTLADAKLTYVAHPSAVVAVGTGKVPYARGALESSRHLISIERPLIVSMIAPGRRLGVTVEGRIAERVGYIAGWMNGTEGFALGNQFGGFITGARVEVDVWGHADARDPQAVGVTLGGGGLWEDEPATRGYAWSADVLASYAGAALKLEALCDSKEPAEAPVPSPVVPDTVDRCGAYLEAGYQLALRDALVQPAVRLETFDDNRNLDDAGDGMLIAAGVNADLIRDFARVQLHYLARRERFGAARANDGVYASLQGSF
jgi:hypothetical protein